MTTRTLYLIAGPGGYLVDLADAGPVFAPAPDQAIESQHHWLSSTAAVAAWKTCTEQWPGTAFTLALVQLQLSSRGHWQPITVQGFAPGHTTTPLHSDNA